MTLYLSVIMSIFKKKTREEKAKDKQAKKLKKKQDNDKEEHEFYCDMEAGFFED